MALALWLVYRFVVLQPTNQRDWEYGMQVLLHVTVDGNVVTVEHERDFQWSADGSSSPAYIESSFDVRRLEHVWCVEEPFTMAPFYAFKGVAHTYFVFDFENQPPVAISVEARRQRDETYDVVRGSFNAYELIYIWATEQDATGRRAVAICTNELARVANEVQPGAVPPNIGLIFPGYADQELYALGFIPKDAPFDTVRQRYAISQAVRDTIDQPDFSQQLRSRL